MATRESRQDEANLELQKGDLVVEPTPVSIRRSKPVPLLPMERRRCCGGHKMDQAVNDSREGRRRRVTGQVCVFLLSAKHVNMRLDYAKSRDSDAIQFSVGEAFQEKNLRRLSREERE